MVIGVRNKPESCNINNCLKKHEPLIYVYIHTVLFEKLKKTVLEKKTFKRA